MPFLSSSYDHTLKIYSTETLTPSASFDLDSVIYSHDLSPIASHLLVACATQHPTVRLVDLRSGASAHALAGHTRGAVLSVAWSPVAEHVLASGGADGAVRLWDVRRSAGALAVLDLEDSVGIAGHSSLGSSSGRPREQGKAHTGAVNGVVWSDDGTHLVSTGHDQRIRVWDTDTGANTLATFGPAVRNSHLSTLLPLLTPSHLTDARKQVLFFPNEREILMSDLLEGRLLKRLRVPVLPLLPPPFPPPPLHPRHPPSTPNTSSLPAPSRTKTKQGQRSRKNHITTLAWRPADVIELYSAHSDGTIRAWAPRTSVDALVDADEDGEEDEHDADDDENDEGDEGDEGDDGEDTESAGGGGGGQKGKKRRKKKNVLDDIYRDLTRQKITFG
ncbi:MAG: hypothetical protein M1838_001628 [Thelocarpon superellum]|nr:MAG: hypothetical protein M1838_001628 [Thelocarpon superellum]